MIHFRLVKSGYAASVREAQDMDTRTVIQAIAYDNFLADYERTYIMLNKADP